MLHMRNINTGCFCLQIYFVIFSLIDGHLLRSWTNLTMVSNTFNQFSAQQFVYPNYYPLNDPMSGQPPSSSTGQMWSHVIPNSMPWSQPNTSQYENAFAFCSFQNVMPPLIYPQIAPPPPAVNQFNPSPYFQPTNSSSPSALQNSIPINPPNEVSQPNKRNINLMEDELDCDFDYDSHRPIKKYICEDKVLEIFDRLHIREGDQYIVEDVVEDEPIISQTSGVVIEEVDEPVLRMSDELKDALKNHKTMIDKLAQNEMDKISKAVVVWQPNPLEKLLNNEEPNVKSEEDSDECSETENNKSQVQIEEIHSDDEDEMMIEFVDIPLDDYNNEDQLMQWTSTNDSIHQTEQRHVWKALLMAVAVTHLELYSRPVNLSLKALINKNACTFLPEKNVAFGKKNPNEISGPRLWITCQVDDDEVPPEWHLLSVRDHFGILWNIVLDSLFPISECHLRTTCWHMPLGLLYTLWRHCFITNQTLANRFRNCSNWNPGALWLPTIVERQLD